MKLVKIKKPFLFYKKGQIEIFEDGYASYWKNKIEVLKTIDKIEVMQNGYTRIT